jgi:hypothetical protein
VINELCHVGPDPYVVMVLTMALGRAVSRPPQDGTEGGIASACFEIHDDVGYVGFGRRA